MIRIKSDIIAFVIFLLLVSLANAVSLDIFAPENIIEGESINTMSDVKTTLDMQ